MVSAWIGVLVVLGVLTWIALGHTGSEQSLPSEVRLTPFNEYERMWRCFRESCPNVEFARWFLLVNGLGNILVFVPLGMILYIALGGFHDRLRQILAATVGGLLVSIGYEIAQIWIPGRVVASDDVILNSIGTAIGAWSISLVRLRSYRSDQLGLLQKDDRDAA
jgi:glycopeptide antibiotics resistance protein